jgi:transcriptional regulator with XRE-family HTH domain
MSSIMKRLRYYRKQAGFTQESAASILGIKPANYAKYERGERVPKDDKLLALAKAFGVSFNALYTGVEREFAELLHEHIKGAVLGDVGGFYAYESDVTENNDAYGVIAECFAKWESILKERAETFYNRYWATPDLRTLIKLREWCRNAATDANSPLGNADNDAWIDAETDCRVAFCVVVARYLNQNSPDDILTEAAGLTEAKYLEPLQFFAVKVFVPYLAHIADAVVFIENTYIGDFESAFLYGALTPPGNDGADDDDDDGEGDA